MAEPAIRVERLGKVYQLAHASLRHTSFREALMSAALSPLRRFRQLSGTDEAWSASGHCAMWTSSHSPERS
jgi:hypothetical protein